MTALLLLADVLAATAGVLETPAADALAFSGVSIDSRTLGPGALFVAIRGPRFDGHDFLDAALARGAHAALVDHRPPASPAGLPLVRVGDTTQALAALAGHVRDRTRIPVVAVTGSIGKTTTKEMTAALLETRGPVLKTEGNLNNQYGLPLTLLRLQPDQQAAVVELGMSAPGEVRSLARLARPDVAVVTRVAPVHLEFFSSLDAIAQAKAEILEGLGEGGTAVLNADDPRVRRMGDGRAGRVVLFGRAPGCAVTARNERSTAAGTQFELRIGERAAQVELPLPGAHLVSNFLAAAAAADLLGVPLAAMAEAARSLRPARHRGELLRLGSGVLLLDDCYNSSPEALEAATATLAGLPAERRVAILGDMLELGPSAAALHRERGRALAGRADVVIGVGPLAREIVGGAREAGVAAGALHHFASAAEAAEAATRIVRARDAVLVKASRGVRLEAVVDTLERHLGKGEA